MRPTLPTLIRTLTVSCLAAPLAMASGGGVNNYCQSGSNGAVISATGSADFNVNAGSGDLRLHAGGLPADSLGLFFYGAQSQAPSPLGNGFLCVGGGSPVWRLGVVTTASGETELASAVDYLLAPNPAAQITPGSAWSFQFWFRNGATSDLTDAMRIDFVPPISLGVPPTVLHSNHTGHPLGMLFEGGAIVINSDTELTDFWTLHTSGGVNPPGPPSIDMTQNTLLAVFLGRRITSGYNVIVTDLRQSVSTLHLSLDETIPCGGTLPSESSPMRLVSIRKLPGAVIGSSTLTTVSCP